MLDNSTVDMATVQSNDIMELERFQIWTSKKNGLEFGDSYEDVHCSIQNMGRMPIITLSKAIV